MNLREEFNATDSGRCERGESGKLDRKRELEGERERVGEEDGEIARLTTRESRWTRRGENTKLLDRQLDVGFLGPPAPTTHLDVTCL